MNTNVCPYWNSSMMVNVYVDVENIFSTAGYAVPTKEKKKHSINMYDKKLIFSILWQFDE